MPKQFNKTTEDIYNIIDEYLIWNTEKTSLDNLNKDRHLAVKAIEKLLDEAYEKGREDIRDEIYKVSSHDVRKFLDGFGHPKDCEMCNERKICQ